MQMKKKLNAIFKRMQSAVCLNPVEVILALLFCSIGCAHYEMRESRWVVFLTYFPILFLTTYFLNAITRSTRWRVVYYFSFFFFIPLWWKENDIGSAFYWVTLVIVQLLYLISTWERDNIRFFRKGLRYLQALLSAGLLAGIAWGLSMSIYFSIRYIFEIWEGEESRFAAWSSSLVFIGVMPLLFLIFDQGKEEEAGTDKLFEALLNYVLSPALLIYAGILYLYFIKIAVAGSLPKGAVAYIVVSFVSATFILRGCQPFLLRRYYDWFYRYASVIVLPALAMYAAGTYYRIHQYGFTVPRVYLVVVGIILTGMAFLFFTKRWGRYLYVAVLTICLLTAVTYIPGITAKDIEWWSQAGRDDNGSKRNSHKEYQYVVMELYEPVDVREYQTVEEVRKVNDGKGISSNIQNDTFCLYNRDGEIFFQEELGQLVRQQLAKAGLSPTDSIPQEAYSTILQVDMDSALLVLDEISLYRFSKDSAYAVSYMGAGYYLKKRLPLSPLKK